MVEVEAMGFKEFLGSLEVAHMCLRVRSGHRNPTDISSHMGESGVPLGCELGLGTILPRS